MTLADLLNTLESADMLRIIKGGEEMFVGYLALFAPGSVTRTAHSMSNTKTTRS